MAGAPTFAPGCGAMFSMPAVQRGGMVRRRKFPGRNVLRLAKDQLYPTPTNTGLIVVRQETIRNLEPEDAMISGVPS